MFARLKDLGACAVSLERTKPNESHGRRATSRKGNDDVRSIAPFSRPIGGSTLLKCAAATSALLIAVCGFGEGAARPLLSISTASDGKSPVVIGTNGVRARVNAGRI